MYRKKLSNVLIYHTLAVLWVIKVIFYQAIFAYKALMLSAKFRGDLLRMLVTKNHWLLELLFDLLFNIFVRFKLYRLLNTFFLTVIRVAKRAIELTFDHYFLALTLDHEFFNTLSTGHLSTTYQIDRLSHFKIELELAKGAMEFWCFSWFHII